MKRYIILICAIFGLYSCQDFLEEDARSSQTNENFYKTEADLDSAVSAIYAFLYGPYTKSGSADLPMAMLEMITGQWNNVSQWPETGVYYSLSNSSASPYDLNFCENCSKGIESANLVPNN